MDIKETREVLDFSIGYVSDLASEKADDGKLDVFEIGRVSLKNAPASVKAILGSDKVAAELSELDAAEIQVLAEKGLALANAVLALLGKSA